MKKSSKIVKKTKIVTRHFDILNSKRVSIIILVLALLLNSFPFNMDKSFAAEPPTQNEKSQIRSSVSENEKKILGYEEQNGEEPLYAEDRVIVKLSASSRARSGSVDLGIEYSDIQMLNPSKAVRNTKSLSASNVTREQNNVFVLTLKNTSSDAVKSALKELKANPSVEYAEPDYLYKTSKTSNDPMRISQYALDKINADQAWDITTGSKEVVVGVIDTGINGKHVDLADNLWKNPNPNENGYINDVNGFDFERNIGGMPIDENGHGTHVAGIIGAKGDNNEGITGTNWNVSLAWLGVDSGNGTLSVSAIIEALNYANNHHIMIANGSWGSNEYSESLYEAISNYKGLFIAGAGNDTANIDEQLFFPASYNLPNIVAVASTDENDKLSSFSNYGSSVDIAAPGSNIWSTKYRGYDEYQAESGTSYATPHVAGTAALVQAVHPEWRAEQIKAAICGTPRLIDGLPVQSGGIVDAFAAVQVSTLASITYNYNDGTSMPVTEYTFLGGKISEPEQPKRKGYAFTGWTLQPDGGEVFLFDSAIYNNLTVYAQWVIPNSGTYAKEFPDKNFCQVILNELKIYHNIVRMPSDLITDSDKKILASITKIDVNSCQIADMTGLKYFTGLCVLKCDNNLLTDLDLSNNTQLKSLSCQSNQLVKLNVANHTQLVNLQCQNNQLFEINVSNNIALEELTCDNNQLAEINLVNNANLIKLTCDNNELKEINLLNNTMIESISCNNNQLEEINLLYNEMLKNMYCDSNQLKEINVTKNLKLLELSCYNNQLTELNISNNFQLTSLVCEGNLLQHLDISNNGQLMTLNVCSNQLTELDVSANVLIENLSCDNNFLIEIDASNLQQLLTLYCSMNQLKRIDVSNCTNLFQLYCFSNEVTELNISNCSALSTLQCSYNKLTELDLSMCKNLYSLNCSGNELSEIDVRVLKNLEFLKCQGNKLSELDVTQCQNLILLTCQENELSELNVFYNRSLIYLDCNDNQLTALRVLNNDKLKTLYCQNNKIVNLVFYFNDHLQQIDCSNNQLEEIDLPNNSEMLQLKCSNNPKLLGLDLTKQVLLRDLDCSYNELKELNLLNCEKILNLNCRNNKLTSLELPINHQIGKNESFSYSNGGIDCSYNELTSLNVANNISTGWLKCYGNYLGEARDVNRSVPNWQSFGNQIGTKGDETNFQFLPQRSVIGTKYFVFVDPEMTNGTIIPDQITASSGTVVTLNVVPDEGYQLEEGSLKYNNTRIYDNTFIMPDDEVMISAKFDFSPQESGIVPVQDNTLPLVDYGYGPVTSQSITIKNTGNVPTGELTIELSGSDATNFVLDKTLISNIMQNQSSRFTVTPKTGLKVGTYSTVVKVYGNNGITAEFGISFTVRRKKINLPSAKENLVYSGRIQDGIEKGMGYYIENGMGKDAKSYIAQVIPDSNHQWLDGTVGVKKIVFTIAKRNQTAPTRPLLYSRNYNSILLKSDSGVEYSKDGRVWQNSRKFGNLKPKTRYVFYIRKKATTNLNASPKSAALVVCTTKQPVFRIAKQPHNRVVSLGQAANLTIRVSGSIGKVKYQWFYSTRAKFGFKKIPGVAATKMNYKVPTRGKGTMYYYCMVTDEGRRNFGLLSRIARVIVRKTSFKFLVQPKSRTAKLHQNIILSTRVTGSAGKVRYQWYRSTNPRSGFKKVSGVAATKMNYKASTSRKGIVYYKCLVKNGNRITLVSKTVKVIVR